MSTVLGSLLVSLEAHVSSGVASLEAKAENLSSWVVTDVEQVANETYDQMKVFLGLIAPATIANFGQLVEEAAADAGQLAVDYLTGKPGEEVISDVLNKAEEAGVAELKILSAPTLNLLLWLKTTAVQQLGAAKAEVKSLI